MKILHKIRIRYFRSLKDVVINDLNELDVFSGKNDSGKSNILKALDAFFNDKPINFDEDYNKERLSEARKSIKGKQFIDIKITITPPKGYTTLPSRVTITKTWDRTGKLIGPVTDDLDKQKRSGKFTPKNLNVSKRTLATLLNKISYTYIPGVRSEDFFSNLLQDLQFALFEKEDRKNKTETTLKKTITEFNEYIVKLTKDLNDEFYNSSNIKTNLSFPTELTLLFRRLLVDTKEKGHDIPLYLRGDGIRLWYIPAILNHIAQISPKIHIWGFDEPENSCEYSLTNKLSEDFLHKYSNNAQIFVSTHSFSFISVDDKHCTHYRVYKDKTSNSQISSFNKISRNESGLLEDLGIITINQRLKATYDRLKSELDQVKDIQTELADLSKPFLIFEGSTDVDHFSLAYNQLFKKDIDAKYKLCETIRDSKGSSIGDGATALNQFLYNHVGKINTDNVVIGVFDYDHQGVSEIKALRCYNDVSSDFGGIPVYQHNIKSNVFAVLIVPPSFRSKYIDFNHPEYCYVSTELLYRDKSIQTANRKYPSKYDTSVFSFKGGKRKFYKSIYKSKTTHNYLGFKPTFKLFNDIIKAYTG